MRNIVTFIACVFFSTLPSLAQNDTNCSDGELGVVVSLYFTQNGPAGEVTWDIQDGEGNVLANNPFAYVANFEYTSSEVCLQQGETYVFNTYDAGEDGWGANSWYTVGFCGGFTTEINNNGFSPNGSGVSENFTIPILQDDCFCFRADYETTNASTVVANDGSATVSTYAGSPPFTYLWSNGSTDQNLTGVSPGEYTLTVTDFLGCEIEQFVEVQGPNIYMSSTNTEVCTGYFYDSSGPDDDFDSNENFTMSICSSEPNMITTLSFYEFDLGGTFFSSATFTIYDGASTSDPVLYSFDSPNDPAPGIIIPSDDNLTGCLTISFTSPWFGTAPGWLAEVNCQYRCQDFNVQITSNEEITADNIINICYELELAAETNYFENNESYEQSDETTSFDWTFNDGALGQSGQQVSQIYDELSETEITLTVTDVNGCFENFTYTAIKDHPEIVTSIIPPDETDICPEIELAAYSGLYAGTDSFISSFFTPITWYIEEIPSNFGDVDGEPIFLPDGSGVSYSTDVVIQTFEPTDILDDDDFLSVCIAMEHSYLGDLEMTLTSPNGTTVSLHEYGGPATSQYLGIPIDVDSDLTEGECWTYCWTSTPTFGTMDQNLSVASESMPIGDYSPVGNFSDFAGSSANGTWTLEVTDNLSSDNGYICGWNIALNVMSDDPGSAEIIDSLTPTILNFSWYCEEEPSSIVWYDSTQVVVQPSNGGEHNYVMTILDSYGCEYTEEFMVNVYETPELTPNTNIECVDNILLEALNVPPAGGFWTLVQSPEGSTVVFEPDSTSDTPNLVVSEPGIYILEHLENQCKFESEVKLDFQVVNPIIETPEDVICSLENTVTVDNPTENSGVWSYTLGDSIQFLSDPTLEDIDLLAGDYGSYTLTYTIDFCDGKDSVDVNFISVDPVITNPGLQVCEFDTDIELNNPSPTGGFWSITDQPNRTIAEYSNFQDNGVNFEVNKFGEYQVAYTILGCNTSDTMNLKFAQAIPIVYTEELVRCDLEADMFVDSYGLEMGWTFVSGPSFADFSNPLGEETSVTVSEYGDYTLAYTACDSTVEFNVLFMCDLTVPNVITANEDNVNDILYIEGLTREYYSYANMSIYNRWGDEVYRSGSYGLDGDWWSGQSTHNNDELKEGVYFYVLNVGNKVTSEVDIYKGMVHLFK